MSERFVKFFTIMLLLLGMERDLRNRDVLAAIFMAALLGFYVLIVLASGLVPFDAFAKIWMSYLLIAVTLWVFVGVLTSSVSAIPHIWQSGFPAHPIQKIIKGLHGTLTPEAFAIMIWPPLLFANLMSSFNAFKQLILSTRPFSWDATFADWDRVLFFGYDGWQITHAIFRSPDMTRIIDNLYHGWFLPMSIGVALCAWVGRKNYKLRNQYLISYLMIWIGLGSIAPYIVPAAGPCFIPQFGGAQGSFGQMVDVLQAQQKVLGDRQIAALLYQNYLAQVHQSGNLLVGGGISAMPSVHNALSILFAIAAWQIYRPLGVVMALYAVVIWIGSVHLGWHYAVDGLVALVATIAIWKLSSHIVRTIEHLTEHRVPALSASPT